MFWLLLEVVHWSLFLPIVIHPFQRGSSSSISLLREGAGCSGGGIKVGEPLIQVQTSAEQTAAVTEAVTQARADQDRLQEQLRGTLDVQTHKLCDAQREIEMYQEQLQRHQENLQQTTAEFEEAKRILIEEKVEAVKHLTLEHELEMVAMKEKWQDDDASRQEKVSSLSQKLQSLEDALHAAQNERNELEKNFQERFEAHFKEEKDKIVQILEASFSEREKKAIESLKEQLQQEHKQEVAH
ncbi:hypothetical protein SK128_015410 [Halocaridina rubra]|uniref:Uncharacterized protein n=1 Tax=Halocaridina rubra TaxID=373956 RepID=A0AAN8X837_HALRR